MENVLLIIAIVPVFIFGFWVMRRVDRFIYECDKLRSADRKQKEPSYVILSGDIPPTEVDREIEKFKLQHGDIEIILRGKSSNTRIM